MKARERRGSGADRGDRRQHGQTEAEPERTPGGRRDELEPHRHRTSDLARLCGARQGASGCGGNAPGRVTPGRRLPVLLPAAVPGQVANANGELPRRQPSHDAAANRRSVRRKYCSRQMSAPTSRQRHCKLLVHAPESPFSGRQSLQRQRCQSSACAVAALGADRISVARASPGDASAVAAGVKMRRTAGIDATQSRSSPALSEGSQGPASLHSPWLHQADHQPVQVVNFHHPPRHLPCNPELLARQGPRGPHMANGQRLPRWG